MGLLLGLFLGPFIYAAILAGIVIGAIIGLLPTAISAGAFIVLGLLSAFVFAGLSFAVESFIPMLFAVIAAAAAVTTLVMIPIRPLLLILIRKIRQHTSVPVQAALVGCLVIAVVYPINQNIKEKEQEEAERQIWLAEEAAELHADLVSVAGEWYTIDYSGHSTVRVSIDTEGNVRVRGQRDKPGGTRFEPGWMNKRSPDLIELHRSSGFSQEVLELTRQGAELPEWPAPVVENHLVTRLDDTDSSIRTELFGMIKSLAANDYLTAEQRMRDRLDNPRIVLEEHSYAYPEHFANRIHNDGLTDLYQFKGFDNGYVTFMYGTGHIRQEYADEETCRHIHGLVYVRTDSGWARIDGQPPERVCDGWQFDSTLRDAANSIIEDAYGELIETEWRRNIEERNHAAIAARADLPLTVRVSFEHENVREWTADQLSQALMSVDAASQSRQLSLVFSQDSGHARMPVDLDLEDLSGAPRKYRTLELFFETDSGEGRITHGTIY